MRVLAHLVLPLRLWPQHHKFFRIYCPPLSFSHLLKWNKTWDTSGQLLQRSTPRIPELKNCLTHRTSTTIHTQRRRTLAHLNKQPPKRESFWHSSTLLQLAFPRTAFLTQTPPISARLLHHPMAVDSRGYPRLLPPNILLWSLLHRRRTHSYLLAVALLPRNPG